MDASITHRDRYVNTYRVRPLSQGVNNYGMDFADRLKRLRHQAGLTQEQLALKCGWPGQSRIGNYESKGPNPRTPDLDGLPVLARALGVSIAELLGESVSEELTAWPDILAYRQAAALGDGVAPDEYAETHKLKFRADSLHRKKLRQDKLGVVYGKGDSMLPRIRNGDAILFDRGDVQPRDGSIFVVNYNNDLLAKQLSLLGGRWFIESLNKDDPKWRKPQLIEEHKNFDIIGRVRWIGSWED